MCPASERVRVWAGGPSLVGACGFKVEDLSVHGPWRLRPAAHGAVESRRNVSWIFGPRPALAASARPGPASCRDNLDVSLLLSRRGSDEGGKEPDDATSGGRDDDDDDDDDDDGGKIHAEKRLDTETERPLPVRGRQKQGGSQREM